MRETTIERAIGEKLRGAGYWSIKLHGGAFRQRGVPDRLVLHQGRALFLETKVPGEGQTPIQRAVAGEILRRAGVGTHVVTSADEALRVVDVWAALGEEE